MKKLLVLLLVSCQPKEPYVPQNWWEDETSEYDRSIIEKLDTATSIDTIFPPDWYMDEGPDYDEVFEDSIIY